MRVCLLGLPYAFRWGVTGIQKQHYCSHEIDFFSFPKIGGDISPKEHPELKSYVHHLCVIDSQQALFALSHRIEPRVWAPPRLATLEPQPRELRGWQCRARCFPERKEVAEFYQHITRHTQESQPERAREVMSAARGAERLLSEGEGRSFLDMEKSGFLGSPCWTNPVFTLRCASVETRDRLLSYGDQVSP